MKGEWDIKVESLSWMEEGKVLRYGRKDKEGVGTKDLDG